MISKLGGPRSIYLDIRPIPNRQPIFRLLRSLASPTLRARDLHEMTRYRPQRVRSEERTCERGIDFVGKKEQTRPAESLLKSFSCCIMIHSYIKRRASQAFFSSPRARVCLFSFTQDIREEIQAADLTMMRQEKAHSRRCTCSRLGSECIMRFA